MKFYIGLTLVTLLHVLGPALGQEPTVFKFRLNAVNVVDTDGLNEGIADPYAIVYSSDSAGTIIGKSEVILETVTPEWETVFEFTSSGELDQDLLIEVWDDDHGATPDDFLGSVLVNVRQFLDAEVNGGSLVNGSEVDAGTVFITRVDEELLPVLPRKLTEFELHHAAFVEAYIDQGNEESPLADRYTLYVSTFNPLTFAVDPKYYIRAPGRHLNTSIWPMVELDKTSFWPNNADFMPSDVAGVTGVVWTSGFLVPGKKKGQLELYDTSVTPPSGPINIAVQDEKDYSYHRIIWKDMDADGDLDALAPRFHVNLLGGTETELVWLENPGVAYEDTPTSGWNQHLIVSEGPDVHIRNTKLTAGGVEFDVIVAAEFWNEKLVLYYTLTGDWRNPEDIIKIELDTELGQTFDLYVSDINLDGRADIVVTAYNHTLGNVFAYEVPDDFRSEAFVKHTLADGFKANSIVGGQSMTPGGLAPFYPYESYKMDSAGNMRKPYIMLSGDDDGRHYILEPVSTDPTNWLYTKHTLVDTYGTTSGKFSVTDLDGDGYMEIVAAGYTSSTMYVFSYSPQ